MRSSTMDDTGDVSPVPATAPSSLSLMSLRVKLDDSVRIFWGNGLTTLDVASSLLDPN